MLKGNLNKQKSYENIILDSIGEGIILTDTHDEIVYMNAVAEEITGWRAAEAYRINFYTVVRLLNDDNSNVINNLINQTIKLNVKAGLKKNTKLITKDGSEKYISATCTPMKNEEGNIGGVVVIFRDITNIRNSELALESEDENLKLILNSAPVGMITLNDGGRISQVNDAALLIMEKKLEEVLDKSMGESFDCNGSKIEDKKCGTSSICKFCEIRLACDKALSSGTNTRDIEINKVLIKKGKEQNHWFKASVTPVEIEGSKNVVISIMDITSNKNKEIALSKSRDFCLNVIDHLPGLVWSANLEGEFDWGNKSFLDF
ncbi:MAG: arcB1, partial [Clostridia bacterium]|nr:arcB1 [Clostridia bacterium]